MKKGATMRPAHVPNEATRATVEALAGIAGLRQAEVAAYIGVSEKTLRKHYRAELDRATAAAVVKVAESLFQKAIGGDTTACIFWLKRRCPEVWGDRAADSGDDAPAPVKVEVQVRDARVAPEPL
jgi:DNA-binding XRE family transcriptional regulator